MSTLFDSLNSAPTHHQTMRQLAAHLIPASLFPWQEAMLGESGVLTGSDLLCLAPTGSGKTTIANGAMIPALAEGRFVLHLVSTRALARERGDALARLLGPIGYRVAVATRDDRGDDDALRQGHIDVLVTVYEKAQSLLLNLPGFLGRVGLVVADEVQLLLDPDRGPAARLTLEVLRSAEPRPQLVALSASLARRTELEAATGLTAAVSEERVVGLQLGTIRLDKGEMEWCDADGERHSHPLESRLGAEEEPSDVIFDLVQRAEKPVLLFMPTRREAIAAAHALADRSREQVDVVLDEAVAAGPVGAMLSRGVGLHTAEQTRAERRAVERLLREGRLSVCCCTTTLAEGINVSARTVLYVPGPEDDPVKRENCLGRAGRPGAGPGVAWIVSRSGGEAGLRTRAPRACPVSLVCFLMAAGWDLAQAVERIVAFQLPGGSAEELSARVTRLGLVDKFGCLTVVGRLIATGGLDPDAAAGWRTTLRRFPDGGSHLANLFLAIGGSRVVESISLSLDERNSGRWIVELSEQLRSCRDPLSSYFLEFIASPQSLPRRIHQAAKGALLMAKACQDSMLVDMETDFLMPAGLIEEFLDQGAFLTAQLHRLAKDLGGDPAPPTGRGSLPGRAEVVPIHSRLGASVRLVIRSGMAGTVQFDGHEVQLTPLQFRLLELLARQAGQGIPYERLEKYVWRGGVVERQQVSYHRTKLEKKLLEASDSKEDRLIETLASWGIRLLLEPDEVRIEDAPAPEELVLRDAEALEDANSVAWTICL
ncbi:DEAD/DEAH box helicase [bacterium]|nr:DEAD/DEAH box helicase [bacterium]